jgi:adenosylcobinamide-phosphate synthase
MNVRRTGILCLALLLDVLLGDPPNRIHPVAGMGAAIAATQRRAPRQGRLARLGYGALLSVGGSATVAVLGSMLERAIGRLPGAWGWPPASGRWVRAGGWPPTSSRWVNVGGWPPTSSRWVNVGGWLAEAGLLKMTFSLRGLTAAADEVGEALAAGNLSEARRLVSWHLVSRETAALSPSQVAAATIESVAENTSDGVVAPLLYYALGGLPAALAYRFINTADSMLGYRDPAYEWLGKIPARLDDLANLLPARVTAGLLALAAAPAGEDIAGAWRVWRRDASKTASPNAGHPMSAMAGALGVELEKVGHYQLGAGGYSPAPGDIRRAVHLSRMAIVLAVGLLAWLATRGR